MRIKPLPPETLDAERRFVHDEISNLIGRSQGPVKMIDDHGALLGPFIPMLNYPQFGIAALSFIRTLDTNATLPKKVREAAILTVGAAFGARFIVYAHTIMAQAFGISPAAIASLAVEGDPGGLSEEESIAHTIASALTKGRVIPDATYHYAVEVLGKDAIAELIFLIGGYTLIAITLNGFDIPSPETKP